MKYVVIKKERGKRWRYWQPKNRYFVNGEWHDCPFKVTRLPDDDNWIIEASELNRQLEKWREHGNAVTQRIIPNSVGWLIGQYQGDERFTNLAPNTQKKNLIVLKSLQEKFGNLPADKMSRMVARNFCTSFPAKSRQTLTAAVCRVLWGFGRDIDVVKENPFENMRLSRMKPRSDIWPVELIEAVKAKAIEIGAPSMALAIQLAWDTGQRSTDLRLLTWSRYTGSCLRFRQSKTGVLIDVPVMTDLRKMLDAADRKAPAVLIDEQTNRPYSKDMLSRRFREICDMVDGVGKLQFRDFRRSAVVRLAEHGCTNAEIAAITGHSLQDTVNILEVYLPRNSTMAKNAIAKLEKQREEIL